MATDPDKKSAKILGTREAKLLRELGALLSKTNLQASKAFLSKLERKPFTC